MFKFWTFVMSALAQKELSCKGKQVDREWPYTEVCWENQQAATSVVEEEVSFLQLIRTNSSTPTQPPPAPGSDCHYFC